MKYEIANEFRITLGPDTSSRLNGSVGGEMVKRLLRWLKNTMQVIRKTSSLIDNFNYQ